MKTANEKIAELLLEKGIISACEPVKKDVKIPYEMYLVLQAFVLDVLEKVDTNSDTWKVGCALAESICIKVKAEAARESYKAQ